MKRLLLLFLIFNFQFSIFNYVCAQRPNQAYWDYIEKYNSMAQDQMRRHGIPASITLAQGLLESGAGKSDLAVRANNHFGIKVGMNWTGPYVVKSDDRPDDKFRKYNSVAESYEDHAQFLKQPRYKSLYNLSSTDYKSWAQGLKQCGYATSPTYAQQLITIIENYELHQYDNGTSGHNKKHNSRWSWIHGIDVNKQQSSGQLSTREQAEQVFFSTHTVYANNRNYYIVVQPGDNLPTLSMMTGVSKRKLRSYNERPKDYVPQPGDILYLQKKRSKADKAMKGIPHRVEAGESMYSIAQRYGIRLESLYKLNCLSPDYVPSPGHLLRLY